MNSLHKTDVAMIIAGNRITGTNKQITIPKLEVPRVAADLPKTGACKGPILWRASPDDFRRLYLHMPNDVELQFWNCAFLINVKKLNLTLNEVSASVLPIFVRREIDLRVDTLPEVILQALNDGKRDFVGKSVTVDQLIRAEALATAEA